MPLISCFPSGTGRENIATDEEVAEMLNDVLGGPSTAWPEPKPAMQRITLAADGWSDNQQTVDVPGVLADEAAQLIQPMPAQSSRSAYYAAEILCTGQELNKLIFTATSIPEEDLSVYVAIIEVQHGNF